MRFDTAVVQRFIYAYGNSVREAHLTEIRRGALNTKELDGRIAEFWRMLCNTISHVYFTNFCMYVPPVFLLG
jgi:hypothetical protein